MAEGVGFLDLHRRPMKSLLTTRGVGQICYWAILGYIGRRNPKGRFNRPSRPSRPSPAAVGVGPTIRHAQETWRHVRPWEAFWLYKSQWTMIDDHPPIMGNQPMIFDGTKDFRLYGGLGYVGPLSFVNGCCGKTSEDVTTKSIWFLSRLMMEDT